MPLPISCHPRHSHTVGAGGAAPGRGPATPEAQRATRTVDGGAAPPPPRARGGGGAPPLGAFSVRR
jgi:hypothetical protein